MIYLAVGLQVEILCQSLNPLILLYEVVILLRWGRRTDLSRVINYAEGKSQEVVTQAVSQILKQMISYLLHLSLLRLTEDLHLERVWGSKERRMIFHGTGDQTIHSGLMSVGRPRPLELLLCKGIVSLGLISRWSDCLLPRISGAPSCRE